MSKIITFNNEKEESCECPTCNLKNHTLNLINTKDKSVWEDIIHYAILEAVDIGKLEIISLYNSINKDLIAKTLGIDDENLN